MEQLKPILATLARHALTSLGGVLVAHGYMQSSQTEQFVAAGLVIAGIAWGWWQKEGQAQVVAMWKNIALNAAKAPADASATVKKLEEAHK